jgi:hypothetical protein
MVAQPEFRHAALKHFLLDIRECRAGRIAGMLGVYVQILSDFHGMNFLSPEHEFSSGIKYTRPGLVLQEDLPMTACRFLSKRYNILSGQRTQVSESIMFCFS